MRNNIPFEFRHREILDTIIDYILEGKITSYDKLTPAEQEKLISICIKHVGPWATDYLYDTIPREKLMHHLAQYKLSGDKIHAYDLIETLWKHATIYYSDYLALLFEEVYENLDLDSPPEEDQDYVDHLNMVTNNYLSGASNHESY